MRILRCTNNSIYDKEYVKKKLPSHDYRFFFSYFILFIIAFLFNSSKKKNERSVMLIIEEKTDLNS